MALNGLIITSQKTGRGRLGKVKALAITMGLESEEYIIINLICFSLKGKLGGKIEPF